MSIDLSAVLERLSPERMGPYLRATNGDLDAAVLLYEWNTAVSGAFYETLQAFEVILRNSLVARLREWHAPRPGRWYDDPSAAFDHRTKADIDTALRRVSAQNRPLTEGQVVTELSFGFWRYLLTKRYTDPLWIPHLRHGFPGLPAHADRAVVHDSVEPLVRLRNRIAHHEPVHGRDLETDAKRLIGVTGWMSRDAQRWMMTWSRIPAVLSTKPPR